jgi:hypothetical protein
VNVSFVYFDQNPSDYLLDRGYPPEQVKGALRGAGYELVISEHNFQEWAACWKSGNPEREERGKALLGFLRALDPDRYLVPVPDLLRFEVGRLLGNRLVGPWLPQEDLANAKALVERFAQGQPTVSDKANMEANWRSKERTTKLQREVADALGRRRYAIGPTFEAFVAANQSVVEEVGTAVLDDALEGHGLGGKQGRAIKFALRRLKKCPALCAAIRANLFINRAVRAGRQLRHDIWDDLKHCVNAAYADVFVTGDQEFADIFCEIRPGPRIAITEDFLVEVGLSGARA